MSLDASLMSSSLMSLSRSAWGLPRRLSLSSRFGEPSLGRSPQPRPRSRSRDHAQGPDLLDRVALLLVFAALHAGIQLLPVPGHLDLLEVECAGQLHVLRHSRPQSGSASPRGSCGRTGRGSLPAHGCHDRSCTCCTAHSLRDTAREVRGFGQIVFPFRYPPSARPGFSMLSGSNHYLEIPHHLHGHWIGLGIDHQITCRCPGRSGPPRQYLGIGIQPGLFGLGRVIRSRMDIKLTEGVTRRNTGMKPLPTHMPFERA